jgi:hypothetical protein
MNVLKFYSLLQVLAILVQYERPIYSEVVTITLPPV